MKKKIKFICIFLLCCVALVWGVLQILNYILVAHLPAWINGLSSDIVQISTGKAEKTGGFLGIGAKITEISLTLPNRETARLENIVLRVPIAWPLRCHIRTSGALQVEAVVGRKKWHIQQLTGKISDLTFQIKGNINSESDEGELSVQTSGLKTFLSQFVEIPLSLMFLIRDDLQEFSLKPQQGYLRFYGIPIIPL